MTNDTATSPEPLEAMRRLAGTIADLLPDAQPKDLAGMLGELERLKAVVWERLARSATVSARTRADEPGAALRHLTPAQVATLLNLKEPYVHELCRTGRLPAAKHGKYWLIGEAALREWLAASRGPSHAVEPPVAPGPVRAAGACADRRARLDRRARGSLRFSITSPAHGLHPGAGERV